MVLAGGAGVVQMLFPGGGLRDGGERLPPGSWPADLPHRLSLGSSSRFPVAWRAEGRGDSPVSLRSTPPPLMTALSPYTSVTMDIWVPPRITKMTDQCHGLCLAEAGFWLAGDHAGGRPERWAVQSLGGTGTLLAAWPWGVSVLTGGWGTRWGSA